MQIVLENLKNIKQLYIYSQQADPTPPLGTVLGNLGVNTVSFCNNFNLYTKLLPVYFYLKVTIYIYENKSVLFSVALPCISFILNILKVERVIKVKVHDRYNDKKIFCVSLYSVLQLAKLYFVNLLLYQAMLMLLGTIKSMNLIIVLR